MRIFLFEVIIIQYTRTPMYILVIIIINHPFSIMCHETAGQTKYVSGVLCLNKEQ